ncbi:uncharacterized protein LOC131664179 [Phymastichus coffea]|uniref:uncharacterized protein LOC131664179 n=1 Tax=Phymastichus coffea TaxID=108790 RepID=UPI00273C2532|nr:uncharacterized protein LOC131664179 [Phymastichus coffea]
MIENDIIDAYENESQLQDNQEEDNNKISYKKCSIDMIEDIRKEISEGNVMSSIDDYIDDLDNLLNKGKVNACTVENNSDTSFAEEFDSIARNLTMIDEEKKNTFMKMIIQFKKLFSDKPGCVNNYTHKLRLKSTNPKINQSYPVPYALRDEVEKCLEKMCQAGIIEPAISQYCNPLRIVRKSDGAIRVCLDARNLNKYLEDDHEAPPIITDIIQVFFKCKYFFKIDMTMGYWQILLDKESRPLTAFVFKGRMYQFIRVPFDNSEWLCTEQHTRAFDALKQNFTNTVCLSHVIPNIPFKIQTNASNSGIAGILYQIDENKEHCIISLASRCLTQTETEYTTTELELLSIVYSIAKFREFLVGGTFEIVTDHKALTFLNSTVFHNSRLIRWSLYLQQYSYTVVHCRGKDNTVADFLSRNPESKFKEYTQETLMISSLCDYSLPTIKNDEVSSLVIMALFNADTSLKQIMKNIAEKQNQDLAYQNFFKQLNNKNRKHEHLQELFNITTHHSTGCAPNELHFGQKIQDKITTFLKFPQSNPINHKYLITFAKKNIEKSHAARAKYQKPSKVVIKEGDLVLLRVRHLSNALDKVTRKFFHLFEGPFKVARDLGRNAYVLVDPNDQSVEKGVYNRANLRKYHKA